MTEKQLSRLMYALITIGVMIIAYGLYLAIFTPMVTTGGVSAILRIALTIGAGLLLLIPSKIFLTLQLMKMNDRRQAAEKTGDTS